MNNRHLTIGKIEKLEWNSSLILGTFEGFHRGHLLLLEKARALSDNVCVLIIYSNTKVLKNHQANGVLSTLDDRVNLFTELGLKDVFLLNLSTDILSLKPQEFFDVIITPLSPAHIIVGEDFRFGVFASGTPATLKSLAENTSSVTIVQPLTYSGNKISTTLIKQALGEGKNKEVRQMLGHYYTVNGFITKGFGLGSKIGFPTANVQLDHNYFLPRFGVYLVRVKFDNNLYFGMASLGYHPTVNEINYPLLEVNVFDYEGDLYHKAINVEFISFLRDEEKYDSLAILVEQIKKDKEKCIKIINEGDI